MFFRKRFFRLVLLSVLSVTAIACSAEQDSGSTRAAEFEVFKSATCGCCKRWVEHMQKAGHHLSATNVADLAQVKSRLGIPAAMGSCHSAVSANGYVFEGHIPARYIKSFLDSPPEGALGLSVPGMPAGSPGMEMGGRFSPYVVWLLRKDGRTEVFASVNRPEQQ